MRRDIINRICANVPLILSLLAFAMVMVAVATGWGQTRGDEGAAAHIFQLLIVAQLPFIMAYFITADWSRWQPTAGRIALQAGALMLALAPVAYFRL
jgi:Zn-dependent protease with chaperone function